MVMSTWCSKHVEAWSKLIVKQQFCASSWLITKINILRCTVSETSKLTVIFGGFIYVVFSIAVHCFNSCGTPWSGRWNDWNLWWIIIYDRTYFISVHLLVSYISLTITHRTDMKHIKLEINFPFLRPHPSGPWTRKVNFFNLHLADGAQFCSSPPCV